ncbi:MAG TPA: DDE-type integrase/transposase/recombinase, partial [Streptosporangiaceae bacterium]|nr:DDE-type integrase/transposase/recombinase [Streptosporangiaceae bacterium]
MTTADEADHGKRVERARETGLFRYSLVQELLEPGLSQAERGWRAREMAGRAHEGPGGRRVTVSCPALTRWRRLYESGGFDALVPPARQPAPRTPEEVLALAEALKREKPGRTAAQVRRILQVTSGWAPSDRTLQRLFERLELGRPAPDQEVQRAFGRFECTRPNEMWVGDTLHGPVIGGKKAYLFAFLDDHSRAVTGARWSHHDDVVRMAAAFRPALQARGVPRACYLDNGSPFVDAWLLRGCAVLGIKLIHSRPGKPEGRGKIERFFRTVREQFLVEAGDGAGIRDLAEMNRLFQAWTETVYHQAVHSETGEAPAARWEKATPQERAVPEPALLREAFLWSERRKADKTALVRMHGNVYQVDAWLAGRMVELLFSPFDLDRIEVRLAGKPAGTAVPFV